MTTVSLAIILALSARADALVKDLGSPFFRDRETAQTELLALGGPALSAVTKATSSPDPEVSRRARGLAKDIGFRVDCARLLAGTTVRLDFTDAPLSVVLVSLSKQSGYAVGLANFASDPEKTRVTIHSGTVSFWHAVEQLGRAAGLTVAATGSYVGTSVRYFLQDPVPVPKEASEKVLGWLAEVEGTLRYRNVLDSQALGVLQVYRNDLKHYADMIVELEKAKAKGNVDPKIPGSIDNLVKRAENVYSASQNMISAADIRFGPGGRYAVVLGSGTMTNGCNHAGVWVEPLTSLLAPPRNLTPPRLPTAPPSGPMISLRVVPEPKIEWVRTTGIRVEHAIDDQGQAVMPKLTPNAAAHVNPNNNVLVLGGRVTTQADQAFRISPFDASVTLRSDSSSPSTLREFRGAVQGVVRASPGEVIARPIAIDPKKETTVRPEVFAANGAVNVRGLLVNVRNGSDSIEPSLTVTGQQVGDTFKLEVDLGYSYLHFATPGGPQDGGALQPLVQVRVAQGQIIQLTNGGSRGRLSTQTPSDSVFGLRVTDAAGQRFQLTATLNLLQSVADGSGSDRAELTLVAHPTPLTTGPPVRIAWHASRLAAVEVPFDLKNVPVLK